jgi:hypothetical protein
MKKLRHSLIITLSFFLFVVISAIGQSPSELRRMRQQQAADSSSKNSSTSQPQTASDRRSARMKKDKDQKIFGDEDDMFKATNIPDKWKNESAVVLGMKVSYVYTTSSGQMCNSVETERERIKLLDKAAVDEYSKFYFTTTYNPYAYLYGNKSASGSSDNAGFRIIKKDGTVIDVDLSKAEPVESSDDVPEYEALYGGGSYSLIAYKKIAIGNLEPGDIIDYYYTNTISGSKAMSKGVAFPALILKMSQHYPVVAQKVDFLIEKGYYIDFASYNGAPELKQTTIVDHRNVAYSFSDNNREKEKDERYVYPYRVDPVIKFQVVYTSSSEQDEIPYFLSQKSFTPLNTATPDMVQKVVCRIANESSDAAETDAKEIIRYMREKHPNVKDNNEYMQDAYYFFRYSKLFQDAKTEFQMNQQTASTNSGGVHFGYANNTPTYGESERERDIHGKITDIYFVKTMGLVAHDRKIDYDYLLTVPRNIGTLDNLLLTSEMTWVLRVKGIPETYLYPFDRNTNPNEGEGLIEGADAYVVVPNRNSRVAKLDRQTLPVSKYTDNVYSASVDVTFNSSMDGGATLKRTITAQGEAKHYYLPEVLVPDVYENLERKRYRYEHDDMTDDEVIAKIRNKKDHDEAVRKTQASMADQVQKRLDLMKEKAAENFTIDTYDSFNLISDGREKDSTDLVFNESFKIKDIIKKVGPNYIANVGMLIEKQTNIKDTELNRSNDIYYSYPLSSNYQITVNIPAGYKVDGADKLNVNVTNATGGFISTASVNGNKLTITTKKYYTSNYLPKSSWMDMVKFMRAAYDFSQQKVLLKKA